MNLYTHIKSESFKICGDFKGRNRQTKMRNSILFFIYIKDSKDAKKDSKDAKHIYKAEISILFQKLLFQSLKGFKLNSFLPM